MASSLWLLASSVFVLDYEFILQLLNLFPNDHRAAGQALGSATHWVCAAGLSFLFPIAMEHFEPGQLFGFFTFMMVLQLLWVWRFVPETKGVPLEEMQTRLGIDQE